ncbi:MAG: hypothetical protein JKY40_01495 [Gammaproteobacteria bacterium]|nr:hypothetical protein [Gammaproteobacteria bacterium]
MLLKLPLQEWFSVVEAYMDNLLYDKIFGRRIYDQGYLLKRLIDNVGPKLVVTNIIVDKCSQLRQTVIDHAIHSQTLKIYEDYALL